MWSVKKYYQAIVHIHLHEKLHTQVFLPENGNLLPLSLVLKFQLPNHQSNKLLLMGNRVLIERLSGQKLVFVSTKKHHPAFNIAKDTQFGGMVTCRSDRLFLFFTYFLLYSLRNINSFAILNRKYMRNMQSFLLDKVTFGLNKLLFFIMLSLCRDWDTFSYIYDGASYGLDVSIKTVSTNIYINKIVLSHFGLQLI